MEKNNEQRKLAFQQSCTCRFSNVLFSGMPSLHSSFTNNELHAAVQNAVGAPLSLLKQAIGLPIKSTTDPAKKSIRLATISKKLGQRWEEQHCVITTHSWIFCRSGWHGPRYHIAEASKASKASH
jgi:hypothetical protein